jgi:hypothetical protein
MSNRARRRAATVSAALLLGALALAGCGRASQPPQPVTAGAAPAAASASAGAPPLPTLPPVEQRAPDLFDPHGCPKTGVSSASCSSTAAEIDRSESARGPGQRLAGYVGGAYSTDPPTGTVVVLDASTSSAATADGHWSATGLVRNQRADAVAGATVHATLLAADGSALETVSGDALVRPIRRGEPAPFMLQAVTAVASQVASVRWSVDVIAGAADASTRDVELQTYWTRKPDDPRRVGNYLFTDPTSGPVPLVVFGAATNLGSSPIARPHVVAAWSDASGRIVLVRDVPASASDASPAAELRAGGADDFLVSVPTGELPPAADLGAPMLWGAGA